MAIKDRKNKKAIFYTIDAMLAGFLIIGALLILSKYPLLEDKPEQKIFISQDILNSLSELKIYEINNSISWVQQEIDNGNITPKDMNNSVLYQISQYWALNETDKAKKLLNLTINNILPDKEGLRIILNTTEIFFRNSTTSTNIVGSSRMISGIAQGSNLTGSSGLAYLRKINNKKSSAYAYFGGFVGQGNITTTLDLGNVTISKVTLEIDGGLGSNFSLFINGHRCNQSSTSSTFLSQTPDMTADTWDLTNCSTYIFSGHNTINLNFTNISTAYIQGGYLKVIYTTDEFQENMFNNSQTYYLPGISGVVNLYDSFYVPGDLLNMTIYLHYNANSTGNNNTFYMTIGNWTIFHNNTNSGEKNVTLRDSDLTILNYPSISKSTIPIRIGFENLTFQTIITNATGFGDAILTTDLSYTMLDSLALAKSLDKSFSGNVLSNNSQNRVGLVSYDTTTDSTLDLTNNLTRINTEIDSYNIPSIVYTCTTCSVVDSLYLFTTQLHNNKLNYWQYSQFSLPPSSWNLLGFDDSSWPSGNTPFGYGVGGLGTTLNKSALYANLWKNVGDNPGSIADFTSGILNSTANTYGWTNGSVGDDGWDWKAGVYGGNSSNVTLLNLTRYGNDYKLRIDINGTANRQISDGSYGMQINITDEMYQMLQNGGSAIFSFKWNWTGCSKCVNITDWMWIKARLTNTTNNTFYLGNNLDANNDSTVDIYATNKTTLSISLISIINITRNITKSGIYYIDFGGKFSRNVTNKNGTFYFDDIQLNFSTNNRGKTYYRNTFQIDNVSNMSYAVLYVSSDDNAVVYLNGYLIDNDSTTHSSSIWNRFVNVPINYFQTGSNVLAVQLNNDDNTAFLDLELRANIGKRQNALVIMTDGGANYCVTSWNGKISSNSYDSSHRCLCPDASTGQLNVTCPNLPEIGDPGAGFLNLYPDGSEWALEQLINISCYLHNKYNIGLYTVAFGNDIKKDALKTLNMSASCDNATHFYTSTNVSGLSNVYQNIADSITRGFYATLSQVILFSGGTFASSILYPDSYISYNYTPIVSPATPGEIEVTFESPKFSNCTPQVYIPAGLRIVDAKIVSYSGIHWTDYLGVNNNQVYNLSNYDPKYIRLGDPFIVQIPPNYLITGGQNNFSLKTGDDPIINTNCSKNNSFIYTAMVNSTISRSEVLPIKKGCNWTVESQSLINSSILIPSSYNGLKKCYYTNSTINCDGANCEDSQDAYDYEVYQIFKQLDSGNNGRILVSLTTDDLEVLVLTVNNLPYMWGPSIMQAEVWQ